MDEGIEPEPKRGFDCETGKAAMARSVALGERARRTTQDILQPKSWRSAAMPAGVMA